MPPNATLCGLALRNNRLGCGAASIIAKGLLADERVRLTTLDLRGNSATLDGKSRTRNGHRIICSVGLRANPFPSITRLFTDVDLGVLHWQDLGLEAPGDDFSHLLPNRKVVTDEDDDRGATGNMATLRKLKRRASFALRHRKDRRSPKMLPSSSSSSPLPESNNSPAVVDGHHRGMNSITLS